MRFRKERQFDWMRLDSTLKKSRPRYISAQKIFLMQWMSMKLRDNFQIHEHSWSCLFHIIDTRSCELQNIPSQIKNDNFTVKLSFLISLSLYFAPFRCRNYFSCTVFSYVPLTVSYGFTVYSYVPLAYIYGGTFNFSTPQTEVSSTSHGSYKHKTMCEKVNVNDAILKPKYKRIYL